MLLKEYPEDDDEDPDDDQKSATKDKNDIENIQDNEFGGYNDDNCSSHQRTVLPNSPVAEKMSSTQKLKHSKCDKKTKIIHQVLQKPPKKQCHLQFLLVMQDNLERTICIN